MGPRRRFTPGWSVLLAALGALNLACLIVSLRRYEPVYGPSMWPGRPSPSSMSTYGNWAYSDGSIWQPVFPDDPPRWIMIRPPSVSGLVRVWWPVAAGLAASLGLCVAGPDRLGRLARLARAVRGIRLTLAQTMILIGAASVWLFLRRNGLVVLAVGSLVLALMVHSAFRRGALAREVRAEGNGAPWLSIAGLVGYSIAAVMGVAWVVLIVIIDSYGHKP